MSIGKPPSPVTRRAGQRRPLVGGKSPKFLGNFWAASPGDPEDGRCPAFRAGAPTRLEGLFAWRGIPTTSGTSTISHLPAGHVAVRALNASAASLASYIAIPFPCLMYPSGLPVAADVANFVNFRTLPLIGGRSQGERQEPAGSRQRSELSRNL